MSGLDNLRGKGRRSDEPASEPGGTVRRDAGAPARTTAEGATRFKPGDEVAGNLQIKKLLGRGGMGEVYLARQTQWDADVVLKIPTEQILADPVNRHRIAREAEVWTDLGFHPHIAYCHYVQILDELLLLVIEYVDGGNLREWIAEGRCADLKTALNLAIQFCHGLEHAHSHGFVHRDIKPENILLTKDGLLKITDFGIVRKVLVETDSAESVGIVLKTVAPGMTMVAIGTDDYMAPEQWGQQRAIDGRADIFALGVCLYEMLCGRRPYLTKTVASRQEVPEPGALRGNNQLPPGMCSLMKRCVDWDREDRPASAQQLLGELCSVYEEVFGEASLYAVLPAISALADDWNNRALSYLALGRVEDAEKAWQSALEADPLHAESAYNCGLYQWRNAKTTDERVVRVMRDVIQGDPQSWLPQYLLAQVHLERGDFEGARDALGQIGDDAPMAEVIAALRALEQLRAPSRLVRTFEGQPGSVNSVCLNADRQYALSSSDALNLWDVSSGRCLRTLEGHTGRVNSVCLSADGHSALSGSSDNTLKLWEVASGRCLRTFEALCPTISGGHTDRVNSVCLSADGRSALSGSFDNTLKLWEVASERCLRTFEGHTGGVNSVCLSADRQYALSASSDKTLKLWDVSSGRCLRTFEGHTNDVTSVCMSPDGEYALSGSEDSTLRLWQVASGRCVRTLEGHTYGVTSVCLSADGQYALSGGWELNLWGIGAFEFAAKFRLSRALQSADVTAAAAKYQKALSAAQLALAAGDALGSWRSLRTARQQTGHRRAASAVREWVKLYDRLRKLSLVDCWSQWTREVSVMAIHLSADGRYVLTGGSRALKLWNLASGCCLRTFEGHTDLLTSVCLSADGQYAVSGSYDGTLKLWDVVVGSCVRTFEGDPYPSFVTSVCLSASGKYVLSGNGDSTLSLWEVSNGRCLRTFEGHTNAVTSVCMSPDGEYALSGSEDSTLRLWQVASGRCVRTLEGHTNGVTSVCLSADGEYALSGSEDSTLKLWQVASGRCVRTFEGHTNVVTSVCVSADGQYALSGSEDKTLKLWGAASERCLRTFEEYTPGVKSVCMSADGKHVVSGGWRHFSAWLLDWELEGNEPTDWEERARPHLEVFLRSHRPYAAKLPKDRQPTEEELRQALTRQGRPVWVEDEFQGFRHTLGCAGFGWLRPEGIRRELERMAADSSWE